jgi:hypothetical protein
LLQGQAPANVQATFALIRIGAYDLNAAVRSVLTDLVGLVFGGVLLVFGRHPDVLGSPEVGRPIQRIIFWHIGRHRPDRMLFSWAVR